MLAQGEFQKVINAKSDERKVILRNIFGTNKFNRIQDIIKDKKKNIENLIKDKEDNIVASLKKNDKLYNKYDNEITIHTELSGCLSGDLKSKKQG